MGSKIKALLWEECRVSGAISVACLAMGLVATYAIWQSKMVTVWDPVIAVPAVLGAPFAISLLLILNASYSGHLAGGFSSRILKLPVPTSVAVASALIVRTVFVVLSSIVMVSVGRLFIENTPSAAIVCGFVLFYLLAQTLDWLRAPVSGLSSALALVAVGFVLMFMGVGGMETQDIGTTIRTSWAPVLLTPLAVGVAAVMALGISLGSVHADRIGKHVGVPEIWEWPKRVTIRRSGRTKPFESPVASQVWFELRRSVWSLPLMTLLIWIVMVGAFWAMPDSNENIDRAGRLWKLRVEAANLLLVALPFGAMMQGTSRRIIGFRKTTGKPGYEYLQPLTIAEFARARVISNCLHLFPTLAVVMVLHFSLAGGPYLSEVVPNALEAGITSWREVVWTLVSRGLLIGVIAWVAMAAGTRIVGRTLSVVAVGWIVLLYGFARLHIPSEYWRIVSGAVTVSFLAILIGTFRHAYKQGTIDARKVAMWLAVWLAIAWLFFYAVTSSWTADTRDAANYLRVIVASFGWASLVPLAYVAFVLDFRRLRHSGTPEQDAAQLGRVQRPGKRQLRTLGAAGVAVAILWLGWPALPAYEGYLRREGLPASLTELNSLYPAVPEAENVAIEYMRISDEFSAARADYRMRLIARTYPDGLPDILEFDFERWLPVVGDGKLIPGRQINYGRWKSTEEYWRELVENRAEELKTLADDAPLRSRYPVDVREGYRAELGHLGRVRDLARVLRLDALVWAINDRPDEAVRSIAAIVPVAQSLSQEPFRYSQETRLGILGIAGAACGDVLNRSFPDDAELARLQEIFGTAVTRSDEQGAVGPGILGDLMMAIGARSRSRLLDEGAPLFPIRLVSQLIYTAAADRMYTLLSFESLAWARTQPWRVYSEWREREHDRVSGISSFHFIGLGYSGVALYPGFVGNGATRTRLAMAETAIAVERFRLARGRLPEDLQELVPEFMAEVREDYFAGPGIPLRYRGEDDGGFVVYSVGRDMIDDGGISMRKNRRGDYPFKVVSPVLRKGPHVVSRWRGFQQAPR